MRTADVAYADGACRFGAASCAMGVFDGVHLGHRKIIGDCIEHARREGLKSVIVTFDRDPEEVLLAQGVPKLLANEDRIALLARLGADVVLVQRFDRDFAAITPELFLETVLMRELDPRAVFVGKDFRFGRKAAGDVALLERMLAPAGCNVVGEELLQDGAEPVTSTRIRGLIGAGRLQEANRLLARPHFIRAVVAHGREVGRTLGFPTANLVPACGYADLSEGVYAGYVEAKGEWHRASISVGVPKTFGDIAWTIEAHLIDFDDDIYNERVTACFAEYLRPMVKFSSPDELVAQIARDTDAAASLPMPPDFPLA